MNNNDYDYIRRYNLSMLLNDIIVEDISNHLNFEYPYINTNSETLFSIFNPRGYMLEEI